MDAKEIQSFSNVRNNNHHNERDTTDLQMASQFFSDVGFSGSTFVLQATASG